MHGFQGGCSVVCASEGGVILFLTRARRGGGGADTGGGVVSCWMGICSTYSDYQEGGLLARCGCVQSWHGRQHEVNDAQGLVSYDQYFTLRLTLPSSVQ